jgi:membrane protein required for colicin V production
MGHADFTVFDVVVFGGMALSGYLAYKRGLVKEVLSLGTWVLAAIITVSCYPLLKPLVAQHVKNEMAVDAASAIGLFCLTIVALVPIGNYLTGLVKGPNATSIDKALGFVFGVVRGFLILSLLYLCSTFVWPENGERQMQPDWLMNARAKPLLAYGVELIEGIIPMADHEKVEENIDASREAASEAIDDAKRLERMSTPVPVTKPSSSTTPAYDQDKLKDLIDRKVTP